MNIDLDALERIAQAATPGPWRGAVVSRYIDADGMERGKGGIYPGTKPGPPPNFVTHDWLAVDAEHIAAFDPTTALALIARVRELEVIVNDGGNQAAKYWTRLNEAEIERDRYQELARRTELQCQDAEREADRYRSAIGEARDQEWSGYGKSDTWHILTRALNDKEAEK